jgi:hypothetical protein
MKLLTSYYENDVPVLFSCKHKGRFYISTVTEPPFFVYARVTQEVLKDFENNKIDINTIFSTNPLFIGNLLDENLIKLEDPIPTKWLVDKGVYLK